MRRAPSTAEKRVVLFTHRWNLGRPTGVARASVRLAETLAAEDRPLRYELASLSEDTPGPGPGGLELRALFAGRLRLLRNGAALGWGLTGRPRLERWLGPVDLVHVVTPFAPVPSRAPVVYTIHDLNPFLYPDLWPRREVWAFKQAVTDAAARAAAIAVPSAFVKGLCVERLGTDAARIEVIPWGVDPLPVAPRPADVLARHGLDPGRYVAVVGQVSPRKNLAPVIAALAETRADVKLALVGPPGHDGAAIRRLIDERGLADRVRVTSFVTDAELGALLGHALALLHPAPLEGFGFPPLEAMAAGAPTAVARGGSLPEVVGDAALLVEPHDVDGWAGAIERLATDGAARADLVAAGRARVARYSWAECARLTAALHARALSPPTF